MLLGCEEHQTAALHAEKKAACQAQYLPLSLSFLYSHATTSKCPCQDLKTFLAQARKMRLSYPMRFSFWFSSTEISNKYKDKYR